MQVYVFMIVMSVLPALFFNVNKDEKSKKRYLVFIFLLIAFFSSLRSIAVGRDTQNYLRIYYEIGSYDWLSLLSMGNWLEPGFAFFNKLVYETLGSFQWVLIIYSCFILFSIARFIYRNSDDVAISTFVFLCLTYRFTLSAMRQVIAISILLYGLELLKSKKYFMFMLLVLMATTFHYSALFCAIYLLMWNFELKNEKPLHLLLYTSVLLLVYFNYREVVSFLTTHIPVLDVYGGRGVGPDRFNLAERAVKAVMAALILVFYLITTKGKNDERGLRRSFIAHALVFWGLTELIGVTTGILARLLFYFNYVTIIAIPNSLSCINERNTKIVATVIICVLFLVYYYFTILPAIGTGEMQYSFFWES